MAVVYWSIVLVDFLMLGIAFRLAYNIRFNLNIAVFQDDVVPVQHFYQTIVFFLIPIWLVVFTFLGLYNRKNLVGGTREYAKVFNSTAIGMFLVFRLVSCCQNLSSHVVGCCSPDVWLSLWLRLPGL